MTFNEAVRAGIKLFPVQRTVSSHVYATPTDGACVLGTAIAGAREKKCAAYATYEVSAWARGVLGYSQQIVCPSRPCNGLGGQGFLPVTLAIHLNDDHKWTREAIAEFFDPTPENHLPMPKVTQETTPCPTLSPVSRT